MKRETLYCGQVHTIGRNKWICFLCWDLLQFSSVVQSFPTLWDPMNHSTPGLPVHHQLPEFTQTYVHWVGDAIQPSPPLSSPLLLPSIFPSIRVFSNESALHIRWPKYWSFSFNISPSNQHPGLISFRMDWLDLLDCFGDFKCCKSVLIEPPHSHTLHRILGPDGVLDCPELCSNWKGEETGLLKDFCNHNLSLRRQGVPQNFLEMVYTLIACAELNWWYEGVINWICWWLMFFLLSKPMHAFVQALANIHNQEHDCDANPTSLGSRYSRPVLSSASPPAPSMCNPTLKVLQPAYFETDFQTLNPLIFHLPPSYFVLDIFFFSQNNS